MKRFLLLFCAVVLVCSIMAVPAFAAETYEVQIVDGLVVSSPFENSLFPDGKYSITFKSGDVSLTYDSVDLKLFSETDDDGTVYYFLFWTDPEFLNAVSGADISFIWRSSEDGPVACLDENDNPAGAASSACFVIKNVDYFDFVITFVPEPEPISPIEGVLGIFSGISTWIINQLAASTSLFWNAAAGSLTFLGILAVASLAFSVILLLIVIIRRFLHFRG